MKFKASSDYTRYYLKIKENKKTPVMVVDMSGWVLLLLSQEGVGNS